MRIEAASLVFVAVFYAVLLVAGISLYVYKYASPGVYVMDRLPSVSPESPIIELAQDTQLPDAMPAPALGPARTPFLPPNFLRTWDMDSLQLDASKPASSFPEPVAPFERTTSFYASKGGKPLILLFTLPTCGYCRLERQALQNATARFGDEVEVLEIDVSTAPYLYQPVFMVDAIQNRVPLLVIAGAYKRIGGPSSEEGIPAESEAISNAICSVFASTGIPSEGCG